MKKFNLNECIWFFILWGFAFYIGKLIYSESIFYFVHPKMLGYIYFSLWAFIALGMVQFRRLYKERVQRLKWGYLFFIVLLVLGIVINPQELGAEINSKKGITLNSFEIRWRQSDDDQQPEHVDLYRFTELNYYDALSELYLNYDKYMGCEIEIYGQVYREIDQNNDEFYITRLMISCCAVDSQRVGVLCYCNHGDQLQNGQWVKIKGVINAKKILGKYDGGGEIMPYILILSLEEMDEPKNGYLYW